MNPYALRNKISRKVLDRFGFDTKILRSKKTEEDGSKIEFDRYGEPIKSPWLFDEIPIRIFVSQDKLDDESTGIGGLPDDKKELLEFFCKGDVDIRMGDKLIFPVNSSYQWLIGYIEPMMMSDVCVAIKVKANKDARY